MCAKYKWTKNVLFTDQISWIRQAHYSSAISLKLFCTILCRHIQHLFWALSRCRPCEMAASNNLYNLSSYCCADKDDISFWKTLLKRTNLGQSFIRVNVCSKEEFLCFKKVIEKEAQICFTTEKAKQSHKFQWATVFRCHHGQHRRRISSTARVKKTG